MAINRKQLAQNIVLVVDSINVTSFSQYWFIKNGIFGEEDFKGSVFTPGLVLVASHDCQLTVLPNQLQFEIKSDNEDVALHCIENRMVKLIKCLANVRVIAIGLNYIWKITDNEILGLIDWYSQNKFVREQCDSYDVKDGTGKVVLTIKKGES